MDSAYVNDITTARHILSDVNWNFTSPFSVGRSGLPLFDIRKYHWYPATFIPEIPYTLIDVLSQPGSVVYDPFSGIGTTVFQSLLLGRFPYGTETNRIAVMIMESFWNILYPSTNLQQIADDIAIITSQYNNSLDYAQMLLGSSIKVELLRPWYTRETFNQIMYLMLNEQNIVDQSTKSLVRIALSATLKAVCSQDRGWGCIADNVFPKPEQMEKTRDALHRFTQNANLLIRGLLNFVNELPDYIKEFLSQTDVKTRLFHNDARQSDQIKGDSVDIIITSPPYPNMTDYSFSQRLSYYWLGATPEDDLPKEIGARRKRSRPESLETYVNDMTETFDAISSKLKKGGYLCLVLPSFYKDQQNDIDRKRAIRKCLANLTLFGYILEDTYDRNLPVRRRHHNQNWAKLEKENIYIYRKE